MLGTYLFPSYFGATEHPGQTVLFCRKKLTPRFCRTFQSTSDQNAGLPVKEERRREQFASEEGSKQIKVVHPTDPL